MTHKEKLEKLEAEKVSLGEELEKAREQVAQLNQSLLGHMNEIGAMKIATAKHLANIEAVTLQVSKLEMENRTRQNIAEGQTKEIEKLRQDLAKASKPKAAQQLKEAQEAKEAVH